MPKRNPYAFPEGELYWNYHHISKATWADLYADLYRQTHGENATAEQVMTDAYRRMGILARNGIIRNAR